MMSRTGSKPGFTLIEVMVATAVLSLGILSMYGALFVLIDAADYYMNYLTVHNWASEKAWQAQDELRRWGPQAALETQGEFLKGAKKIVWNLSYNLVGEEAGLYKIDLVLAWKQGARISKLPRSAYACFEEKK